MFGWLDKKGKTKREIIINAESLETRVAVLENGKLEEFQAEHTMKERIVGSIFKGKIQNLEHDLQAAFVDIGMKKNAFLHYWDMVPDDRSFKDVDSGRRGKRSSKKKRMSNAEVEKKFPIGSEIVVQVTKGQIGTKGPRVTANLSIPGRFLVMMPGVNMSGVSRKIDDLKERQRLRKMLTRMPEHNEMGMIIRTAAIGVKSRNFTRDYKGLLGIWQEIDNGIKNDKAPCCVYNEPDLVERVVRDWLTEDIDRIIVDSPPKHERLKQVASTMSRKARSAIQLYQGDLPVFDQYGVEEQLSEAFRRKVNLKSGGYIIFDETEALIAVDVNTGRHKGKGAADEAIFEVNLEAVDEVARQLRLRNVGGLVVLDLIDMRSKKHQNAVFRGMKVALRRDRARTNVLPISDLGLMEMTRQRVEESILSSMYIDCPYCNGRGNVKSPLSMSVDIQRQISAVARKSAKNKEHIDIGVIIHPTVLERLRKEDEEFLIDLESRFDGRLTFKSDPSRHVESFSILNSATGDVIYSSD
ncbi:hypothetical protein BVX97_01275 [bacterium E08(2017)]|nr:hypothetical protein BVX97_01275 [bacterium E08(2017)]